MSDERATNPNKTVVTVVTAPPGRPKTRDACLVIIYGDDLGRRVPLGTEPTVIGRSSKCDVQIDQESVSRNHCRVSHNRKGYVLRDLGSTNGTYLNDELVDETALRDGDQIKVGRTILKFIMGGNMEAQYHEEIYRLMTIDGLTEVHNKRYFQEMLEKEASRSKRYDRIFSVVLLDIDHFKDINDSYGHLAGDAVLRQLGALLKSRMRRDDVTARIGGEEFALILPEVSREQAAELAERLRQLVETTRFEFEGTNMPVTVSLGVAQGDPELEDADALIKVADERLYHAKNTGRNRVTS